MPDGKDPFEELRAAVGAGNESPPPPPSVPVATPQEPEESGPQYPRCGSNPVDVAGNNVDLEQLRTYNWDETPWDGQEVRTNAVVDDQGRWRAHLAWEQPSLAPEVKAVYRVLVGEGQQPDEECSSVEQTLVLTTNCEAVDASWINKPESSLRYYEVWCYAGNSIEAALKSSPYPVGSSFLVWPATGLVAEVDHGQILVSWDAPDDRSCTFRVLRQSPRDARATGDPRPEQGQVVDGAQYVDLDAKPGEKYVYTVFVGADVDGHREWSRHARTSAKVPAHLRPVLDLSFTPSDDGERVSLSWTPVPGAEVRIYRSQKRPALAAEQLGVIDASDLAGRVSLAEDDRLHYHPVVEDGRAWMRDVAIPPESTEIHFTPVTAADHKCAPGKTLDWLRLRPPTDPFVEDRVDWILVVFAWPTGATDVLLYASEAGGAINPATLRPLDKISAEDHREFGGFRVDRSKFTAGTRELHLVASRFAGHTHYSDSVSVRHTFPALISYKIEKQTKFRSERTILTISAAEDVRDAEVKLGWHEQYLPMASRDCQRVLMNKTLNLLRGEPYPIDLSEQVQDLPTAGYIRLLSRPTLPIAVIDPPIDQLRL